MEINQIMLLVDMIRRPIPEDGYDDIRSYNDELAKLSNPTWFNVPWLYAECYMYR